MIRVSRLNNEEFYINSELIELIEETPNTVITLTTGKKIIVSETVEEIIDRVVSFKQRCITQNVKTK